MMIRKIFCVFCVLALLCGAGPAAAEEAEPSGSVYRFDVTFSLNADAFPLSLRNRAAGYAELINILGLKGTLSRNDRTASMDLDASFYFVDRPSLSYPFRIYGTETELFLTSPLIRNEILYLKMQNLQMFLLKVRENLALDLTWLSYLFPYSTREHLWDLTTAWNKTIGEVKKNRTISNKEFTAFSKQLNSVLQNTSYYEYWLRGLCVNPEAAAAVETEFYNLPNYVPLVTGGKSVKVTKDKTSEIWRRADGSTLFSRVETEGDFSMELSLPASENGYLPAFSILDRQEDTVRSFSFRASLRQQDAEAEAASPAGENPGNGESSEESEDVGFALYEEDEYEDEYEYEYEYEEYGEESLPAVLLNVAAEGNNLPLALPADASFDLSALVEGVIFPNVSLALEGQTKKDGALSLILCRPHQEGEEPAVYLRCSGTVLPADPSEMPEYVRPDLNEVYDVFSFNDQRLSSFTNTVIPPFIRSVFSFVEAAPTAACQAFLDDLTDLGMLDYLVELPSYSP